MKIKIKVRIEATIMKFFLILILPLNPSPRLMA